jgi:hypothetical protein
MFPFVPGRCAGTNEDEVLAVVARKCDENSGAVRKESAM